MNGPKAGWCEVYGRGSGRRLEGLHRTDTDRPFGKMTTFCGVIVSAVFPAHKAPPEERCKPCSRRSHAP